MRTFLSALAALVLSAGPAFAQTVAFVTNLRGEASIDAARAALLAEMARGQKIALARDASLSAMYIASGKEYVLKGPGEWLVKDNEIAAASGLPPMVRHTEWRTSGKVLETVAQASAASVRMRSIAPQAPLPVMLFPTAGRVATLQPTLRWRPAAAAGGVQVAIYIPGHEKAVHTASASGGAYQLPVALEADTEYAWTLAAAGREIASARFRTLAADALRAMRSEPA
ncbi:MAG TPA: hypothetical protein VFP36_01110, partial [Usitatibacter sp.]|nr:hypothetical protein [Usitatibacter sp.]